MSQEEINILAAEFNLSDEGNETEMFAKALTLCQKFRKEMKAKEAEIERLELAVANIGIEHSILVEEAQAERSRFLELQKHTEALVRAIEDLRSEKNYPDDFDSLWAALDFYRKSFPKGGSEK